MTPPHDSGSGLRCASRVLNAGCAHGRALVLSEELSFWGGFNPTNGLIIDKHHPQAGLYISDQVLVLPASRGSAGTPAGVAESLRIGRGPAAVIVRSADVNITIGVAVAAKLYDRNVPVVALAPENYLKLASGQRVRIHEDGLVTIE